MAEAGNSPEKPPQEKPFFTRLKDFFLPPLPSALHSKPITELAKELDSQVIELQNQPKETPNALIERINKELNRPNHSTGDKSGE